MHLADAGETEAFGRRLAGSLRAGDVIALSGPLGAGKTALARGILAGLAHHGDVPSPTFPLVIPYEQTDPPVWHVDLYRLDNAKAAEELGLDEALTDGALIIEWPERLGARLWPHALRLSLAIAPSGGRDLTALVPSVWEPRWPPR
jgi:tRNA threonylcarbamoyladenosine biosynthesis protein TsaE